MAYFRFLRPDGTASTSTPPPPPGGSSSAGQQTEVGKKPEGPPAKKPRRVKSTAGIASKTPVAIPEPVSTVATPVGPANLWIHGLTPELRRALQPPSQYSDLGGFTPEMMAEIAKMQETTFKAASLLSALHSAGETTNTHLATIASLEDRVKQLEKEVKGLSAAKAKSDESSSKAAADLTSARDELKKAQSDLDEMKKSFDELSSERDKTVEKLQALQADFTLAVSSVSEAAHGSWDNCLTQARLLNPGLVTEGMSVFCVVRDGQIVANPDVATAGDGIEVSESMMDVEIPAAEGAETPVLNVGEEVSAPPA